MTCIILSIGDELILGQTIDTNSAWLSQQLAAVGCAVSRHLTVADDFAQIRDAIAESAPQCDFLVITGGLGPTADDLTRQALAAAMGQELEMNSIWLAKLAEFFAHLHRPMPEANKIQAMIPRGARMIANSCGTAAGIEATLGSCRIFVMPGVPREMKEMFARDVLPAIAAAGGGGVILSRALHTFGLGESSVAQMLGDLMNRDRNPSVGTTVSAGVVSLRINARFDSRPRAIQEIQATEKLCRAALGDLIYGADEETLPAVVGKMLVERGQSVTTAESCTGGLLAKMITDASGSSRYFKQGWITYANSAKRDLLEVSESLLKEHGAVSEAVANAMASGARRLAQSDFALSITGVAGPDGGTPDKPVGTVWIGLATPDSTTARMWNFPGDRQMIRDRAARMALSRLRYHLLGKPMP